MACVPPQVSDGVLRCVHWLNYTTFRLPLYYQSSTSRNVTLTVTAPAASGALARSPRGRCSPSGRQTRRFRGSVTRDSATYRDPCAKTGSGMYTATRPLQDGRKRNQRRTGLEKFQNRRTNCARCEQSSLFARHFPPRLRAASSVGAHNRGARTTPFSAQAQEREERHGTRG